MGRDAAAAAVLDVVRDVEGAAVLLNPLRLRIVHELREPASASGLSKRLGMPRQKLNYHLRELEQRGFLQLVEERKKGNCTERILRASARSYLVDPRALGDLAADPEGFTDRFSSSYLMALAGGAIRDLCILRERAERARKKLPTLSLEAEVSFASAEEQARFAEELGGEISRLVAKYHDDEASESRRFRIFLGSYPAITKEEKA